MSTMLPRLLSIGVLSTQVDEVLQKVNHRNPGRGALQIDLGRHQATRGGVRMCMFVTEQSSTAGVLVLQTPEILPSSQPADAS